ncbi:MAG: conjugative transposon protein TraM [Mucilaginibacter sp.]
MKQKTIQYLRHRKMLLVLPLIAVPLLCLAFYALGGGRDTTVKTQTPAGINTSLPGPHFDKHQKQADKMSFYQQAKQDSERNRLDAGNPMLRQLGFASPSKRSLTTTGKDKAVAGLDPNVEQIDRKLAEINRQIARQQPAKATISTMPVQQSDTQAVNKLESLARSLGNGQGDPEMERLSQMLDKIQQIQHPETVKPHLKPLPSPDSAFKAIPATVDGKQKVLQGGEVRIKLTDSIRIKGLLLPKGQLLFGSCMITNQRLMLDIRNVRLKDAIVPVSLTVFSLDGMPGIPAPEAELANAAGSGADNAVESMQFLSMDQSLATQAAAGGIQAAKTLLSKKVRKVRVHLKDGYPVLLRINHN